MQWDIFFKGLCLSFLPNVPGAMFILESRVDALFFCGILCQKTKQIVLHLHERFQKGLLDMTSGCVVQLGGNFYFPMRQMSEIFSICLIYNFQNFSLIWTNFFHSFQGGTKGKMLKNCQNYKLFFSAIFLWSPPWKL